MSTTKYIQLEEDLQDYLSTMDKAQQAILDQEISNYPIFVIHQHEIELGVLLVDGPNLGLLWSVHASTLEEFMSKQIIQTDKIDELKTLVEEYPDIQTEKDIWKHVKVSRIWVNCYEQEGDVEIAISADWDVEQTLGFTFKANRHLSFHLNV